MGVEPVTRGFIGDPGDLSQFVSFLEAPPGVLDKRVNRFPVDPQIGPHSSLQDLMSLTIQDFHRLHRSLLILPPRVLFHEALA
jgi:hypothetical protein